MSQLNVDNIQNRTGSGGGPNFPSGITVAVGQTAYIHGNLRVDGTETIVNTETLNVADKTVGIGSTSNASNTTADGAGIEVFASHTQTGNNKTLTWQNSSSAWTFAGGGIVATDAVVGSAVTINSSGIKAGIITASSGVKVTGGGIDITGNIGLGGATYGSSGQVLTSGGSGANASWTTVSSAPVIELVANGALTANAGVIVSTTGKVEALAGVNAGTGTRFEVDSSTCEYTDSCKLEDDKFVICYQDEGNSNYGTAVVVTASGTTLSKGTSSVFSSNPTYNIACCKVSATQFAVLYYEGSNSRINVRLGIVSGTSITWGAETDPSAGASPNTWGMGIGYQSDVAGFLMVVSNTASSDKPSYATAYLNGTTITLGSGGWSDLRNSATARSINIVENTTDNELLVTWISSSDQNGGRSRTCKLAGSTNHTVTLGQDEYVSNQNQYESKVCYNSTNNVYGYVFRNSDQSNKIGYCCGTPSNSGTNRTISWTNYNNVYTSTGSFPNIAYDATALRYMVIFADSSGNGRWRLYKQDGTGMTADGADAVFESGQQIFARPYPDVISVGGGLFTVSYVRGTEDLSAIGRQLGTTNLTSENFIGFADANYSDGQTATIKVVGNTVASTGLTPGQKYYVEGDGSLTITEGDPSVIAGTSLSSTLLLIKPQ